MEEDIKVLEELTKSFDNLISYRQKQAIENLIARNKELEEDLHDDKEYIRELHHKLTNAVEIKYIHEDYIPKSKVKEKIEENKWAMEHYDSDEADYKQSQAVGAWQVLYHLLQEGDK